MFSLFVRKYNCQLCIISSIGKICRQMITFNIHGRVRYQYTTYRRGSRGGIWGFIPLQFFASQNYLKCLS